MRILLISPWDRRRRRYRTFAKKLIAYPPLTLPMLAALVPSGLDAEITVFDEMSAGKPPSGCFDLVGITVITSESKRAYALADHYRERGSFVVLGGYHVTFMPEEALLHADSIVTREADEAWPALLRDFSAGRIMKRIYEGGHVPVKVVRPKRDVLNAKNYCFAASIIASRGCGNRCAFCSVSRMSTYMHRDAKEVIEELKTLRRRVVIFFDPNFFADKNYALALMKQMEPLKLHWGATATVDFGFDETLLSAARKSGCSGVLIGFESMNQSALLGVNKAFRDPARY
ncbi:MAG: radical SAM protein, partial [Clostridiales Family XIII bacterium]|nr:radical SAM protein [Clostridiales Family XIII bacterium]